MRISDWSSDVCSSDLKVVGPGPGVAAAGGFRLVGAHDMTAGNDDLAERAKAAFADGDFKDSGGGFGGHGWLQDRTRAYPSAARYPCRQPEKSYKILNLLVSKIGRASCRESVCQYG